MISLRKIMKIKKSCPKCKSDKIKIISYIGVKCIVCNNCGFDESSQYEVFGEEKKSQKAKGNYAPYKSGGYQRSRK